MYFFSKTLFGFQGIIFFQSFIFLVGLFYLSSYYKNPYFIILLIYPLLVIILSMGFVRQSLALGFVLIALRFYLDDRIKLSILFSTISIFFHSSFIIVNLFCYILYLRIKIKHNLQIFLNKYF